VIDPIDGTRAFLLGMPTWGTLIGLEHAATPVMGVMDQPFTGERFWSSGAGAWYKDPTGSTRRLATRRGVTLPNALMATTDPALFTPGAEADGFGRVKAAVRTCRYGTDCYAYCMLAMGLVDIVVEAGLKPYDIVALIPIIENAGGLVTTWDGKPARAGGRILACGDPALHAEIMTLLA
jgi:myo-inositol-1(or 4)-monophosphatase